MPPARELLLEAVGHLTDEQARQVLELIGRTCARAPEEDAATRSRLWDRLAGDPSIVLPARDPGPFEDFEPVDCRGIPASQLLIADRR